jgi:hypothetical protein
MSIHHIICLFATPQNMPPLDRGQRHSSDYGVRVNHPTSFNENPSFRGPLVLEELVSPDYYRNRIRRYYLSNEKLKVAVFDEKDKSAIKLCETASTATILKSLIDHLARNDAPVDVKEVAESTEFYLRTSKRLIGAARRVSKNKLNADDSNNDSNIITIHDLCSGHGLTGMLFVACNPPRGANEIVRTVLVDRSKPQSHDILRKIISEVCPWVTTDSVQFVISSLENYASNTRELRGENISTVISTHACGTLTDKILNYSVETKTSALAVMPCCYTGTDYDVPYGLRRMLGVSLSADVRRSFYLQDNEYHVDFATIPKAITPMNRIIVAEQRK